MLDSAEAVYAIFGAEFQARDRESLKVVLLDTKLRLLRIEDVALGSLNECVAHPREILRPAIVHSAYAMILIHNHPSGDPAPSQADLRLTRQLGEAAKLLQITFLDHIIIGLPDGGRTPYFSFRRNRLPMKIHPAAIVSARAHLAEDVEIGAHAIIGDNVTVGDGCVVQSHAVLEGRTTLGAGNFVGYGAIIGAPPQDFAYRDSVISEVRIGNANTLREYVTVHRGTKEGSATLVGNDCYLMVGTHLGHNVKLEDRVVIANNCLLAGYVEVGSGAVLGGGTVFHQFLRVGPLTMVRGGTRFGKDIPPYVFG